MKRLRVLLIKPFNVGDHIQPSLGLGYLASAIRKKHDVFILDAIKENICGQKLIDYIRDLSPDIAGFQLYTYDLAGVRQSLNLIKKRFPQIITIAGGPHPSALPEGTLVHMQGNLDFVFRGECEESFPKLLDIIAGVPESDRSSIKYANLKNVAGLCWSADGRFFSNPPMLIKDLDALGMPAWDLIKPQTYPEAQHGAFFKRFPIAPIMTGRGCPFSCTFCEGHIITGKSVRKRSVSNVIEEIKILTRNYGIREIHVVDDNFSIRKDYVMEFCARILSENIKISWATPNGIRIDSLDKEMLWAMKKSGYYLASVGIEFGTERMFQLTKKGLSKEKIEKGIKLIKSAGLQVAGFFIIGYPGETKNEIRQTIKFALSLPLIRANFFIFLPLPGTEVYKQLETSMELDKVDWEHFHFTNPVYIYRGISVTELKNFQREAFLKFFLRPNIFISNLLQIKTFRQIKFLFKRLYRWVLAF